MTETTIEASYSFADRERSVYQYLDFEVPATTGAVTVTLDYPDDAFTIIDLGLIGPDRFRGWSGGERDHVTVAETWATPGYLPGLLTGHWQVMLGLYRVPFESVEVVVGIDLGSVDPPPTPLPVPVPERPPSRTIPTGGDRQWVSGDLHSHTVHSDGKLTVDGLLATAAARGLDFLAVTDHNTVSHHPELETAGSRMGVIALPGQEVTTDVGHANCLGRVPWVDFRFPADDWLTTTVENGGAMSVNHPWAGHVAWRKTLTGRAPLVEMWHHTWDRHHETPLLEWPEFGRVPVGGSDFHRPGDAPPGNPTTWVEVDEPTVDGIIDGLAAGRVAIGADPSSPLVYGRGEEVAVVDGAGCVLIDGEGGRAPIKGDDVAVTGLTGPFHLLAEDVVVSFTPGTRGV